MSYTSLPSIEVLQTIPILNPVHEGMEAIMPYMEVTFQFDMVEIINIYIFIRRLTSKTNDWCSMTPDILKTNITKYIYTLNNILDKYIYPSHEPITTSQNEETSTSQNSVSNTPLVIPILQHLKNNLTNELISVMVDMGTTNNVLSFEPSTIHTTDLCICLILLFVNSYNIKMLRSDISSCPPLTILISWLIHIMIKITSTQYTGFNMYIFKYIIALNVSNNSEYNFDIVNIFPTENDIKSLLSWFIPENTTSFVTLLNAYYILYQIYYSDTSSLDTREKIITLTIEWMLTNKNINLFINELSSDITIRPTQMLFSLEMVRVAQCSIILSKLQYIDNNCKNDSKFKTVITNLAINLKSLYSQILASKLITTPLAYPYTNIVDILKTYLSDIYPPVFAVLYSNGIEDVTAIPGGTNLDDTNKKDAISSIIADTLTNPFATNITLPLTNDPNYGHRVKWDSSKIQSRYNLRTEVRVGSTKTYTTANPKTSDHAYKVFGIKPKSRELIDRYNLSYSDVDVVSNTLPEITQLPPRNLASSTNPIKSSNTNASMNANLTQSTAPMYDKITNIFNETKRPYIPEPTNPIIELGKKTAQIETGLYAFIMNNKIIILGGFVLLGLGLYLALSLIILQKKKYSSTTTTTTTTSDTTANPKANPKTDSTIDTNNQSDISALSYLQNNNPGQNNKKGVPPYIVPPPYNPAGLQQGDIALNMKRQSMVSLQEKQAGMLSVISREDLSELLREMHQLTQIYSTKYDKLDTYYRPSYYNEIADESNQTKSSNTLLFIYGGFLVCFLLFIWIKSLTFLEKTYYSILGIVISNPFIISYIVHIIMNLYTKISS
jgi:hypothetical protein